MSDLILSLSHYHRHTAIYVVYTFGIRLAQTGCTARKLALFIISQDRQTQLLAAIAMATTIIID